MKNSIGKITRIGTAAFLLGAMFAPPAPLEILSLTGSAAYSAASPVSPPRRTNGAGSVFINEIAWMGTVSNAADEWVELYNSSGGEVDLTGWDLYEAGGALVISLTGKIPAGGYYLIERSDDNTVSDIPADVFAPFGGGGLNNGGEYLVLKNSAGEVVDSVDASGGWTAGDNSTKASMERKADGAWQTNNGLAIFGRDAGGKAVLGTPKAANSQQASSSPAATSTPPPATAPPAVSPSDSASGIFASTTAPVLGVKADAGGNAVAEIGQKIKFNGSASVGAETYKWYLGDGQIKEGKEIVHTYRFPGVYLVTLEVANGSEVAIDQIYARIFGGRAVINEFFGGAADGRSQWIELFNPTNFSNDLSGWILETGGKNFVLPPFVVIPKGGFLTLAQETTGLDIMMGRGRIALKQPGGLVADEVVFDKIPYGFSANRSGNGFFWSKETTPGRPNVVLAGGAAIGDTVGLAPRRVEMKPSSETANYYASFYSQVSASANGPAGQADAAGPASPPRRTSGVAAGSSWQKIMSGYVFWIAVLIILAALATVFFIRFKKRDESYR